MPQVICLSTSTWYPYPTRKQQVMSRLPGCDILYVNPPITLIAPLRDPALKPRLKEHEQPPQKIKEGLHLVAPPPVMPFYNKYRSLNRRNQKKLAAFVREKMGALGFEKPVLWCYHPSSVDILDHVPHSAVVYDCVDRHSAYPGLINPRLVDAMERDLAARADMVFATAQGLCGTLAQVNPNTHLIPNGANYELFAQAARDDLPVPEDIAALPGPVVGFIGTLQPCIDTDILLYLAQKRPGWSFVLIGNILPGVDVSALQAQKNIHMLGLRGHDALPAYIARFDLCLNLFRAGDLAKDVSPLKFYEYLATGKPVVSTPQPDQVNDFRQAVYIAQDPEDYLGQCEKALGENDPRLVRLRQEWGQACSWDNRVLQMENLLKKQGIF